MSRAIVDRIGITIAVVVEDGDCDAGRSLDEAMLGARVAGNSLARAAGPFRGPGGRRWHGRIACAGVDEETVRAMCRAAEGVLRAQGYAVTHARRPSQELH